MVAPSNHNLPKAAARRLALPSKRKPSRFVYSNTIAQNVAAAKYTLAVRAAQRRASSSQLKRSLQVFGNACSAVNQHMRQMRMRGPLLLQCRPPPALGRVAEALLPVQPLPLLKQTLRLILFQPQKMAALGDALGEIERVHDAVFALDAQ